MNEEAMSNENTTNEIAEDRGGTPLASSDNEAPSASDVSPKAQRVELLEEQLEEISLEDLRASWKLQDSYINSIESLNSTYEEERKRSTEREEKLRQQVGELSLRERVLMRRLAAKEQDLQEYATQLPEVKVSQVAGGGALRNNLLDPAVNLLLERLRQELADTRVRLEDTQNELSAWKFTPDSNTGKRLMAKCRLLYQENEELGAMVSKGRLAKLEGDLALQKSFSEEVKKSQSELEELLQDLDEDVEGMQSTIYFLQQELKKAKETAASLEVENSRLRRGRSPTVSAVAAGGAAAAAPGGGQVNGLPPSSAAPHSNQGGGKWAGLRSPPDSPPPPATVQPQPHHNNKRTRETDSDCVVNNNYEGQRKRTSSDASSDDLPVVKKPKQGSSVQGSDDEVVTNGGDKGGQ